MGMKRITRLQKRGSAQRRGKQCVEGGDYYLEKKKSEN